MRTRALTGCATGTGCRSSACATAGCCRPAPGRSCGASWLGEQRFEHARRADHLRHLPARGRPRRRADRAARAGDPGDGRAGAVARAGRRGCAACAAIDTLTALGLVAEIGDFGRFRSAEEFMAFVGLVPSEHSSGEQRRQGSITKVGNSHVRRLLVESAWHARPPPEGRLRARPPPTRPRRRS